MNTEIYAVLLLIVVVIWPLSLAIPALHTRLPWPRHLAIVPAALLALLPGEISLELPWLLFGTGLAMENETRWILAMSVAIWFAAAAIMKPSKRDFADQRTTTFFLLTLAGNLGAVLAIDLVGFFCFATLMGYGFYGLLLQAGDDAARRAGRRYLIVLIVADLLLFEALLLAAFTTENLRFEGMREAMAGASSSSFYLWMVFAGFALKAGAWPAHLWLTSAFRSAPRSTALLLGGVPVAMGLFGAVRWLPIGEHAFGISALIIQGIGVAAILYAMLRFFTQASVISLPAWTTVALTGLFIAALGIGLSRPALWQQYESLAYPFISSVAIFLATLAFVANRTSGASQPPTVTPQRVEAMSRWVTGWTDVLQRWAKGRLLGLQSLWRASWLKAARQYQRILDGQQLSGLLDGWNVKITLFVLLGLALAWLAG
jgi:formate hydrogenlyase subunit 3/multisubunit Na+/H+ antiporter MnhD subunit